MQSANGAMTSLIRSIKLFGTKVNTRNSVCSRITAETVRFERAPLVTLRKTAWKSALREWEWFMSGSNNINDLHESVRPWWQPWASTAGTVESNYSHQFRKQTCLDFDAGFYDGYGWGEFDQVAAFIDGIKHHPFSRRNVITTWYSPEMYSKECPITNCHGTVIQAFVGENAELEIVTYQRSCDLICGVPHNWIQYWAFLLWVAHRTGTKATRLTWVGGDVHIYEAHQELAKKMANGWGLHKVDAYPGDMLYTPTSDEFKADDFTLSVPPEFFLNDKAEMIA
jgi:thymidylate synthase